MASVTSTTTTTTFTINPVVALAGVASLTTGCIIHDYIFDYERRVTDKSKYASSRVLSSRLARYTAFGFGTLGFIYCIAKASNL